MNRDDCWFINSGAYLKRMEVEKVFPDAYQRYLREAKTVKIKKNFNDPLYDAIRQEQLQTIRKDVSEGRTDASSFEYGVGEFLEKRQRDKFDDAYVEQSRAQASRILTAYCIRNRIPGYVQGMNNIAALLLAVMEEEQAFWTLCACIEDLRPVDFYTSMFCQMNGFQMECDLLAELSAANFPELLKVCERNHLDLTIQLMASKLLIPIFINQLPLSTVTMVLNSFCSSDAEFGIIRIFLALIGLMVDDFVLTLTNKSKLQKDENEQLAMYAKGIKIAQFVTPSQLQDEIDEQKLPPLMVRQAFIAARRRRAQKWFEDPHLIYPLLDSQAIRFSKEICIEILDFYQKVFFSSKKNILIESKENTNTCGNTDNTGGLSISAFLNGDDGDDKPNDIATKKVGDFVDDTKNTPNISESLDDNSANSGKSSSKWKGWLKEKGMAKRTSIKIQIDNDGSKIDFTQVEKKSPIQSKQENLKKRKSKRKTSKKIPRKIPDPIGMTDKQFFRLVSMTHNLPDMPSFSLYPRQYKRVTDLYINDEHDDVEKERRLHAHQLLAYLSLMLLGTATQLIDFYFLVHDEDSSGLLNEKQANQLFGCIMNTLVKIREDQIPRSAQSPHSKSHRRSRSIGRSVRNIRKRSISRRRSFSRTNSRSRGRRNSGCNTTTTTTTTAAITHCTSSITGSGSSGSGFNNIKRDLKREGNLLLFEMMPGKLVEYVKKAYDEMAAKYSQGIDERVVHFSTFRQYVLADPILLLAFDFKRENRPRDLTLALIKSLIQKCFTDSNNKTEIKDNGTTGQKEYYEWLQLAEKGCILA